MSIYPNHTRSHNCPMRYCPHQANCYSGSKADIWSVGGVIYQMVTGKPPWKDLGFKSPIALFLHLKSHDNPPKLPQLKNCDDRNYRLLARLSARLFQRNPALRPSAAALLSEDVWNLASTLETPSPTIDTPTNCHLSPSPALTSPFNQIPENAALDSFPTDSLCYSLTLKSPLPKGNTSEHTDASEWPAWAQQNNKENAADRTADKKGSGQGVNPFEKSGQTTTFL